MNMKKLIPSLLILLFLTASLITARTFSSQSNCAVGVWDNSDFSRTAADWSNAARKIGGQNGIVDLTVALATENGMVELPFPYQTSGYLISVSSTDEVESYLHQFDSDGLKVILSIQPLKADVSQLIGIVLSRYSKHKSILGVNVDIEWKESGTPNHVNNAERDAWLSETKTYNTSYRLFLTYFKDYTYFPEDQAELVVLFDGEADTQANLLTQYAELAKHFSSVGIYTGYSSSTPPTASYDRIMNAVPDTKYIIHTEDVFSKKPAVIFEMDDVQIDWLENVTINLTNVHMQTRVPVVCGVIPNYFNDTSVGGGYLPGYLKDLSEGQSDLFEIGQHGYTHNASEMLAGKSYKEQKTTIEDGLSILNSIGIEPSTFMPPYGSADENTAKAAEDLGFKTLVSLYGNLSSTNITILDNWVSLTEGQGNTTTIKSPEQLMAEIDNGGKNVTIVLYEIEDFAQDTKNKLATFSQVLNVLQSSEKYVFLTPTQYRETLADQLPMPSPNTQKLPDWILYLVVAVAGALVSLTVIFLARKRVISKRKTVKSTSPGIHGRVLSYGKPTLQRLARALLQNHEI